MMENVNYQNNKTNGLFYLKLGCLLFWACWFTLACLTNFFDFINGLYGLPADWHFRSGNYAALKHVLSIYHTPLSLLNILFSLDIIAQGLSAILFYAAFFYFLFHRSIATITNFAFVISMALWAIFILMEEIFIAYSFEGTHIRLFMFEMITLVMLYLLPHEASKKI